MADAVRDALTAWQWAPQPEAERIVHELIEDFSNRCPPARALARRMLSETGPRFADWLDHLVVPFAGNLDGRLRAAGFVPCDDGLRHGWSHADGLFPDLVTGDRWAAAIMVESVADAAAA